MSVVAFTSTNIRWGNQGTFGGTGQLSNLWMGTTNVSFQTIYTQKIYPRGPANGASLSHYYLSKYRVIRLNSNDYTKGNVRFTYPITLSSTGNPIGDDYAWNYLEYAYVTITAVAVYPYTFQRWETLTPTPAGTNISTSASVNLYNTDWTGYYTVKAVFA